MYKLHGKNYIVRHRACADIGCMPLILKGLAHSRDVPLSPLESTTYRPSASDSKQSHLTVVLILTTRAAAHEAKSFVCIYIHAHKRAYTCACDSLGLRPVHNACAKNPLGQVDL